MKEKFSEASAVVKSTKVRCQSIKTSTRKFKNIKAGEAIGHPLIMRQEDTFNKTYMLTLKWAFEYCLKNFTSFAVQTLERECM